MTRHAILLVQRILLLLVAGLIWNGRRVIQPGELARRLVREMDDHQLTTMREVFVPDRYDIYLATADHARFAGTHAALTSELAEFLAEHARRKGYAVTSRPRVSLLIDDDLSRGTFGIAAFTSSDEHELQQPAMAGAATTVQPAVAPAAVVATAPLALVTPDGTVPLTGDRLTLGRGRSNSIIVHDPSVSREHAVIEHRDSAWTIRDLDSTNGLHVRGRKVSEHVIADGDVIRVGNIDLRVQRDAGVATR